MRESYNEAKVVKDERGVDRWVDSVTGQPARCLNCESDKVHEDCDEILNNHPPQGGHQMSKFSKGDIVKFDDDGTRLAGVVESDGAKRVKVKVERVSDGSVLFSVPVAHVDPATAEETSKLRTGRSGLLHVVPDCSRC